MGDGWFSSHSGLVGEHWAGNWQAWVPVLARKPTNGWPWARLTLSLCFNSCMNKWLLSLDVLWFRNHAILNTGLTYGDVSKPHANFRDGQGFLRGGVRRARRCPGDQVNKSGQRHQFYCRTCRRFGMLSHCPWVPLCLKFCLPEALGTWWGKQVLVMWTKPGFWSCESLVWCLREALGSVTTTWLIPVLLPQFPQHLYVPLHSRCAVRVCGTSQLGKSLFPNVGVSSYASRMAFCDSEFRLAGARRQDWQAGMDWSWYEVRPPAVRRAQGKLPGPEVYLKTQ